MLVTFLIYAFLKDLRNIYGKMMGAYSFCYFVSNLALIIADDEYFETPSGEDLCKFFGVIFWYFILGALFWLNSISFNLWLTFK